MSLFATINPTIASNSLELELADVRAMYDVLYSLIDRHFGPAAEDGKYALTEAEGQRLFFAAGTANCMAQNAEKAFRIALENNRMAQSAKKGGAYERCANHPLGFSIAEMDFQELWSLHHALRTVFEVLAGLRSQPRFHIRSTGEMTRAALQLGVLQDKVAREIVDIEDLARGRVADGEKDQSAKFSILASNSIGPSDSPMVQVAAISQLAMEAVR